MRQGTRGGKHVRQRKNKDTPLSAETKRRLPNQPNFPNGTSGARRRRPERPHPALQRNVQTLPKLFHFTTIVICMPRWNLKLQR